MNWTYCIVAVVLLVAELVYFRIAEHANILDRPNERSSHSFVVLRGGGIIFCLSMVIWAVLMLIQGKDFAMYWPFLCGLLLLAGVGFRDDVHSLPNGVRLVAQLVSMILVLWSLDLFHWNMWWVIPIVLVVCIGMTNIINFMDGINGITGGYAFAVLLPLLLLNREIAFIEESYLVVAILGVLIFCFFNFRPRGKVKCFAGDVGSYGIAVILLFAIGKLIVRTGDFSYIVFFLVYGVDGCLTIVHRILLHENLGEAHRKHAYQLMANELEMDHVKVSTLYLALQLAISLAFVYLCPDTAIAHWLFLLAGIAVLALAYVLFMKKYYHLHEEYLKSLE